MVSECGAFVLGNGRYVRGQQDGLCSPSKKETKQRTLQLPANVTWLFDGLKIPNCYKIPPLASIPIARELQWTGPCERCVCNVDSSEGTEGSILERGGVRR